MVISLPVKLSFSYIRPAELIQIKHTGIRSREAELKLQSHLYISWLITLVLCGCSWFSIWSKLTLKKDLFLVLQLATKLT